MIVGTAGLAPAWAQTTEANLSGIVFDNTRGSLPGATVTLSNQNTGIARTTTSNDTGSYQFSFVQPGTYTVEVTLDGFRGVRREGLQLSAAQNVRVDFTMEIGTVAETITVSASAPLLNTGSAQISDIINAQRAESLPINGRNFWSLAQLTAGVTPPQRGSGNSLRGGFSVSGSGEQSNNFILNGLDNNDSITATPLFRPSVDSLEEMTVLSGMYPAQYGFLSGGQIITTIKSGTNQFHGSAFEFNRNAKIGTAKNYFQSEIPEYNRNSLGGTVGGPIATGRTFFFFSHEGLRLEESIPITGTVPTAAMKSGDFSGLLPGTVIRDPDTGQPFPGNVIPRNRVSAIGSAMLALYPDPSRPTAQGAQPANNYFWNPTRPENTNTFTFKIDQKFSDYDSAYVSLNRYRQNSYEPIGRTGCNGGSQFPGLGCQLTYSADVFGASETHTFSPNLINQVYLGYSLGQQPYAADGTKIDFWGQFGLRPRTEMPVGLPTTGIPAITITGYTNLRAGSQYRHDPRYQVTDTLSWTKGRHTIKSGFNWSLMTATYVTNIPPAGSVTFTNTSTGPTSGYGVADTLLGLPATTAWTDRALEMNFNNASIAAFIQDDYRVSGSLSLNLGLRWELNSPLRERDNELNSFDRVTGQPIAAGRNGVKDYVYEYDYRDFAPRVGFAYQPFEEGHTVLRGGFGTFYNRIPAGTSSFQVWGGYPFATSSTYTSSLTQPISVTNPFPGNNAVTSISVSGVDPEMKNPRTYQWSLGIQRQLPAKLVADIAYVGSVSRNQLIDRNINQPAPGPGTPAQVNARRPYPQYGNIAFFFWDGTGSYNALQTKLSRRLSDGLSFSANYTYGHTLTDTNGRTNESDPSTGYGPASFDIRHRLVVSGAYDLPFGEGRRWLQSGVAGAVLGGWQLTPVFQTQSGAPLTATLTGNFTNNGGGGARPDLIGDPNKNAPHTPEKWFDTSVFVLRPASGQPGATYSFGNAGIGVIRGPGTTTLDASLVRTVPMGKTRLQMRIEVFNVLNTVNWGNPGTTANTPTFGVITTAGDARLTQFSLKLTF
ncbi:MAG: TonB-dependent receptor [Cyanobacteria bacterium]|nr:TonB-dependent receptor [Cyanobacteriota bacterium]